MLLAADTVLGRVGDKMSHLQSVRDSVRDQLAAVLQLYEQNLDSVVLTVLTERTAAAPSIADMLECLQDAERFFRRQYPSWSSRGGGDTSESVCCPECSSRVLQRKTLLQSLSLDHVSLLESAPRRWTSLDCPESDQQISGQTPPLRLSPAVLPSC